MVYFISSGIKKTKWNQENWQGWHGKTSPKVAEGLKAEKGDEAKVMYISWETVPDNSIFLSDLEKPLQLMF